MKRHHQRIETGILTAEKSKQGNTKFKNFTTHSSSLNHSGPIWKANDMSGPLLSESVISVAHDHFITFHVDMDIDGPTNSFVEIDLVKE
ncbi:hypothetical protein RND71_016606 [Anisodus tanguticus]|uniref:Copper amine oxidase catalytic domain-containing protein n=1 Tax=Anisodus tanguticus TaxID=243964 RepID=A0AAE1S7I4_9SOLA|nr:hypothetical protein RND71_016606 [Anisodus tanguticus]